MDTEHIQIEYLSTWPKGWLYYYQGNFYHPLDINGATVGKVRGLIRKFKKANKELVDRDRSHPDYKTLVEIFDEQMPED